MERALVFLIILLVGYLRLEAQIANGKIQINGLNISENENEVSVSFVAHIEKKAVKRNNILVFAPVVTNSQYSVSFPAIIVEGKGAHLAQERREWIAKETAYYKDAIYTRNQQVVEYNCKVAFQPWMQGATLSIESVLGGCCNYEEQADLILAQNIRLRDPQPVVVAEPVTPTVAEQLSTAFPFVIHESEYDESESFKIYDDERNNSLVVYFQLAKYDIVKDYMHNAQALNNLVTAINMILDSEDSRVKHLLVSGFASPEGNFEFNNRLAFERAVSVKQYIMETTKMRDEQIKVYNGSVDWRGLRSMVAKSQIPERQKIIHIIDNVPIEDNRGRMLRLEELKRLNNGRIYNYLLYEYFPYLRNGAFIKVYYENE